MTLSAPPPPSVDTADWSEESSMPSSSECGTPPLRTVTHGISLLSLGKPGAVLGGGESLLNQKKKKIRLGRAEIHISVSKSIHSDFEGEGALQDI